MNRPEKISIASAICSIVGIFGIVTYFIYIFMFIGNWFNPELLENEMLFFDIWVQMARAVMLGFLMLAFVLVGLCLGIYGISKTEKGSKVNKFALAGAITGGIGFIVSIIMSWIYFFYSSAEFFEYFINLWFSI